MADLKGKLTGTLTQNGEVVARWETEMTDTTNAVDYVVPVVPVGMSEEGAGVVFILGPEEAQDG